MVNIFAYYVYLTAWTLSKGLYNGGISLFELSEIRGRTFRDVERG